MKITVAVDIMGGDNPASELAAGAINAAKEFKNQGLSLILVGTEEAVAALPPLPENVTAVTANSVVEMTDDPSIVMKDKKPVIDRKKCIRCFCCQEFCPKAAMVVHRPPLAKILSK